MSITPSPITVYPQARAASFGRSLQRGALTVGWRWRIGLIQAFKFFAARIAVLAAAAKTKRTQRIKACP